MTEEPSNPGHSSTKLAKNRSLRLTVALRFAVLAAAGLWDLFLRHGKFNERIGCNTRVGFGDRDPS